MGANSLCNVCRTMGLNLSGPAAVCGFKHTSSLSMPPADMPLLGIFEWGLVEGWLRMRLLPPPPREFRRHRLSCRELKAESFKKCCRSVRWGVSM